MIARRKALAASPLSRGPADPLIWAHFQIDEVGVLTLPTLVVSGPAGVLTDRLGSERVLERYELLYEAGLVGEARRDRGRVAAVRPPLLVF